MVFRETRLIIFTGRRVFKEKSSRKFGRRFLDTQTE